MNKKNTAWSQELKGAGLGWGEAYLTEKERVSGWPLLKEDVFQSCNGILKSEE